MTLSTGPSKPLAELRYRMPAEWEPHEGTWVSWPHNPDTWPKSLELVKPFFGELIAAIAAEEMAHVNVAGPDMEAEAYHYLQLAKANAPNVCFHHIETNDAWCRDYGAIIVQARVAEKEQASRVATAWGYNAWGGKYPPYDRDQLVAEQMARALGIPCRQGGMILEGGAIEVNGAGTLLTTEQCLLNPNRNGNMRREVIEARLRDFFGVQEIVWLAGGVAGDDTDGHVDNLCRFVNERTIVTVYERDREHPNFASLHENFRRLEAWRGPQGSKFEIIKLPTPPALSHLGQTLPASYGNFLITNHSVLLPQFGAATDEQARGILQELFPNRQVRGIDSTIAIRGLGAIHCLTQQVPL